MLLGEPFGGLIPGARGGVLAVLLRTGSPLTGRQVHALLSDRHGLWTVQQALKELAQLGMITTETIGRAGVHVVNEDHAAIPALRSLLNPMDLLSQVVRASAGEHIEAVIVFGSVARGEAGPDSDVDLAVIAPASWERRVELEDAVRTRLGNTCDVVHLTHDQFTTPGEGRDAVVDMILREGIALVGSMPRPAARTAS